MARIHLERPPRTDDELDMLIQRLWGIRLPRKRVCIEHDAPFDAFATAFFARAPQILVHGSRGLSGKSVQMATLGQTNAVVWGADCNILGGSLAQSTNVMESMQRNWSDENAPTYMLSQDHKTEQVLTNGARLRPLTASQRTVRGPHPARLLLDEIDEMDQAVFDAAKGQPMPQKNWLGIEIPAQTMMASTWQYPDGTFAKEYKRFKEEGLPIFTWCYRESAGEGGWLSPETIEQKKREVSREMWRVEYELGEPSIGNRAIDTSSVEDMFDVEAPAPLKWDREYQEYEILDYDLTRDYVVGADWAKENDWTVITVWDVTEIPIRLAYYVRMRRRPYPFMIGTFNQLLKRYRADGIHDKTGLGGVVDDYIAGDARGFLMTGEKRDSMLSEFVSAVENNQIRASRIDSFYTSMKYASTDDLYSRSKEFHLPDEVCSAALAWKMVSVRFPVFTPFAPERIRQTWMAKAVEENKIPQDLQRTGDVEEKDPDGVFSLT